MKGSRLLPVAPRGIRITIRPCGALPCLTSAPHERFSTPSSRAKRNQNSCSTLWRTPLLNIGASWKLLDSFQSHEEESEFLFDLVENFPAQWGTLWRHDRMLPLRVARIVDGAGVSCYP